MFFVSFILNVLLEKGCNGNPNIASIFNVDICCESCKDLLHFMYIFQ